MNDGMWVLLAFGGVMYAIARAWMPECLVLTAERLVCF